MKNKQNASQTLILNLIVDGKIGDQEFLPSICNLEQLTGCCRQTVYNALRGLTDIGVLTAIERRGYRVCNIALAKEMLRPPKEMQLAFVLPRWISQGASSPCFSEILQGAEEVLKSRSQINLVYLTLPWDAEETRFDLRALGFRSRKISGAMLVGPTPDFIAERFIEKSGIPTVLVDNVSDLSGAICVSQDNLSGSARAVRHLYEMGHRRIGMVSVRPRKMRINERFAGFYVEMHRLELLDQIAFIEEVEWDADTIEGGAEAARRLIAKGFGGATALLALNDNMAFGMLQVLSEQGIRVPEDISIIAIGGDARIAALARPRLTTMAVDFRTLGQLGMSALLDRLQHPETTGSTTLLSMALRRFDSVAPGPFAPKV